MNLGDAVEITHANERPGGYGTTDERMRDFEERFGETITAKFDDMLVDAGVIRPKDPEQENETWTDRLQQQLPNVSSVVTQINKLSEELNPPKDDFSIYSSYLSGSTRPIWAGRVSERESTRTETPPALRDNTRLDLPDAIDVEESQSRLALEAPADYEAPKTEVIIEPPKKLAPTTELKTTSKVIDVESHEVPPQQKAA